MVDLRLVKPSELWYIIGLIVTDGNLSKDRRHINITSKDEEILIKIKTALKIKNKLTLKSRASEKIKKYYFLQFGDVWFYKYLEKLGLMPKKSLILKSINVPKKHFIDFLRGIIDGDGCIYSWTHRTNGHTQWSLRIVSAAPFFSSWIKNEIENYFNVKGKLYGYTVSPK